MSLRVISLAGSRSALYLPRKIDLRPQIRKYTVETAVDLKPTIYGQPLFASHPHLIQPNEITPGIPAEDYEIRRRKLMDSLPDNSLVVSIAGQVKYMSGQIFYKFRQASDFWYLTGFEEPDSALILEKNSSSRGYHMMLFSSGKNTAKELWDGASTSFEDVKRHFRSDDALPISAFPSTLKSLTSAFAHIYIDLPPSSFRRGRASSPRTLLKYLSSSTQPRTDYDGLVDSLGSLKQRPLAPELAKLRAIKSQAEQRVMRTAADISARAHTKTMRFTRPGMSEHVLAAHFEYLCAREGSQRPAYVPVVASGPNALTIHYTSNNQIVRPDELVLIDAACEYKLVVSPPYDPRVLNSLQSWLILANDSGYASDITRTYPASGTFTPPQAALYAALLAVQKQLISCCTATAHISLAQLHHKSCALLRRELRNAGLEVSPGALEGELYPHYVGHPIGVDLHESNHFDRNEPLKEGMVVTIEPGIYVPPSPAYPTQFHNIGIRIEDEVLVGKDSPIVLSIGAPKEISDVEGACQGLLGLEPF